MQDALRASTALDDILGFDLEAEKSVEGVRRARSIRARGRAVDITRKRPKRYRQN